jgi:hypothetical protein
VSLVVANDFKINPRLFLQYSCHDGIEPFDLCAMGSGGVIEHAVSICRGGNLLGGEFKSVFQGQPTTGCGVWDIVIHKIGKRGYLIARTRVDMRTSAEQVQPSD